METGCVRGVERGIIFTDILAGRNCSHLRMRKPTVGKLSQNKAGIQYRPVQSQCPWIFHLAACEERLWEQLPSFFGKATMQL